VITDLDLIIPDWPAPARVRALSTTRTGGFSPAPWDSFNLGSHVQDDPARVESNRRKLAEQLGLPLSSFSFLNQVHGTDVARLPQAAAVTADACVTSQPAVPCLIMTADCLPVLFCNHDGTRVAAAHAGWRGLCEGVLEQAVQQFEQPGNVMAWLGPAIGPEAFEVGAEVREAFMVKDARAEQAFVPQPGSGRYLGDLNLLARQRLIVAGVTEIYGGHWCTFSDSARFYSYRRDGVTGRMASLIYIE
jgi:YfiH family protein